MRVIRTKWKLFLYAFGTIGVNLLNIVVGSYLCSAIIADGFGENVLSTHTFEGINLVIPAIWAIFGVIAKIVDGIIDIPMAQFTDRLRCRWGRRRPSLILGLIPMIASYCLFLLVTPDKSGETIGNTVFYFIMLVIFYSSYTLTMVTYYATFTEIVDNEADRRFLTNMKSISDIVYFIIGFAAVPMILKGLNIRMVGLVVLPMVLFVAIPLIMIKEKSTKEGVDGKIEENVNIFKSIAYTFKNKDFLIWMGVYSFMTFGLQLFLNGINEYFSVSGMEMIYVMMAAFAPVPLTFIVYNKLVVKKGFKFAYQYTLLIFSVAMTCFFAISFMEKSTLKLILSILCGLISSFSVGAMFAVAYSIPSQLAADDEKRTGISHSAMYFAIQGLFAGIASGIGGAAILTLLKKTTLFEHKGTFYITITAAAACMVSFALAFFLPKSIATLGKKNTENNEENIELKVEDKTDEQ